MNATETARVIHEPTLRTLMMVEKAILDSAEHPTRMGLWKSLPKKVQYQTFERVLSYLEASGKIVFQDHDIIYTGVSGEKLRKLLESSVRVG